MSGFVCPNCDCTSQIFPPITGGATKMCDDMKVPLLGQVPLEPKLLLSCEGGKCYIAEHPESQTAKRFVEIVKKVESYKRV